MTAAELIISIIVFIIAVILLSLSIRHFQERGSLLNNAYINASEEEWETMDKSPYYRQTAIVFCLLGIVFIIIGLSVIMKGSKIVLLEIPVLAAAIIYAIVSSVQINKQKNK